MVEPKKSTYRTRRIRAASWTLAALGTALAVGWTRAEGDVDPCRGRGTTVFVDTDAHRLRLCAADTTFESYRVALGRGGVDKRREGDGRTPLGTYPLGPPRRSSAFHRFLHVGYPTAAQRRAGYTGSAIGVHGPSRRARRLGRMTTLADWTQGCIAVGTDSDIVEIARWVEQNQVRTITLE